MISSGLMVDKEEEEEEAEEAEEAEQLSERLALLLGVVEADVQSIASRRNHIVVINEDRDL